MNTMQLSVPTKNPLNGAIGHEDVNAEIYGPLCIHVGFGHNVGSYVVTHVPTGYLVLRAGNKTKARQAIRELRKLPVDWQFTDPVTVMGWPKEAGAAIKEIRQEAK